MLELWHWTNYQTETYPGNKGDEGQIWKDYSGIVCAVTE